MKLDILAFGAHPDDVELGCGATLAKEISQGKTVGIIDLTQGELGTRGTEITRAEEAKNAGEVLGISIRENLKFEDTQSGLKAFAAKKKPIWSNSPNKI